MDCNVNHSIFLRSNGSLACWCDYGSLKTLQEFDPSLDYANDVYLGKLYNYIREQLASDTMPFPSYRSKRMVLLPHAPFLNLNKRKPYIATFQVEPSLECHAHSPCCIPIKHRKPRITRPCCRH